MQIVPLLSKAGDNVPISSKFPMEALDKAILERRELDDVNVALTRSELA